MPAASSAAMISRRPAGGEMRGEESAVADEDSHGHLLGHCCSLVCEDDRNKA